jgi:hypothetical protein
MWWTVCPSSEGSRADELTRDNGPRTGYTSPMSWWPPLVDFGGDKLEPDWLSAAFVLVGAVIWLWVEVKIRRGDADKQ